MKTLLVAIALLISVPNFAQSKQEQKEAARVAFITNYVGLTTDEAQKFWPIFNELQAERKALRKNHKPKKDGRKIDEMTDAEVEKLVDGALNFKQEDLALAKKYHEKFKSVLPIKKVAKLYHAEKAFKQQRPSRPHPGHK